MTALFPMREHEPVITALWGEELRDRRLLCKCREVVVVVVVDEPWAWTMQHGENPEHRAIWWFTADLGPAQQWLEAIHRWRGQEGE